jgi:glutamate synthase (ferredoxin)
VIAHYREELQALVGRGIRPLLTLHHFSNPLWLEEKGAFAKRDNITYFLRFVRRMVEGVGDHGCEYMTGGRVVVLGETGKNFAAGMSGGVAYVWDPRRDLYLRLNKDLVSLEPVAETRDLEELRDLIAEHVQATGSERGRAILADFEYSAANFKKILPRDYAKMLQAIAQREGQGMGRDEAELEAFYAVTGGAR